MYRSNQARIKKEIPSLLLGRGQGPRPASSLPRSPSRHNYGREQYPLRCSEAGTVAQRSGYCSPTVAASPSTLSLPILAAT